jgi:hypothetical protein
MHILAGEGVIIPGVTFTVMVATFTHPAGNEYMISVTPGDTPVTTPEPATIVAIEVSPLVQLPPEMESESMSVLPWHNSISIGDISEGI